MRKRPFELLALTLILIFAGGLGATDALFIGKVEGIAGFALLGVYAILHPLTAAALWSLWSKALKFGRALTIFFLLSSFFYYATMTPLILLANDFLYVYALFYLYRPDVRKLFSE